MAIVAKAVQRPLPESGLTVARCCRMIHIGTSYDERWDKTNNKVRVTWELPQLTHVFNEEAGEQPFVIDKQYNVSMHEKATLRGDLEDWRGKAFTPEEVKHFDITNLVGAYCMINVVHNEKDGKKYANVGSISPLMKGMEKPKPVNKDLIFDFDNHFDLDLLETFPDFIKDAIKLSDEYKMRTDQSEGAELDKKFDNAVAEDEPVDDLPF